MEDLKEINFNGAVILNNNRVKGPILPKVVAELDRDVTIQENSIVEGAIYAHRLEIINGDADIQGAVYTQLEFHVSGSATGRVILRKTVASSDSIVSYARECRLMFMADINAKQVKLCNAFVAGSVFADDITLDNCVVLGGVFSTKTIKMKNCIVGTFNSQEVGIQGNISLLLPSAFSVMPVDSTAEAAMFNLGLADLGALYRGLPQAESSGIIGMDLNHDELKTVLTGENEQQQFLCYTVVGKILAADLLNMDKLNNHFLIGAASLGSQLLRTYDLGLDAQGEVAELTPEKVSDFFFNILEGRIEIQELAGNFSIKEIAERFKS